MFFRAAINALVTQEWGERMCFNAWTSNGLAKGDTWGARMPIYDGFDVLGRGSSDPSRSLWVSATDRIRNQMAMEGYPPRNTERSMFLPGVWQEPVNYEMEHFVFPPVEGGGLIRAINPTALGPSAMNPG